MNETETIIIGGGLSGLFTAYKLQELNSPYLLLEAKSIFGGRVAGYKTSPGSELSVDLGPTWFWPHQVMINQLLSQLNVGWFEQYCKGDALYQKHPDAIPSRIQNNTGGMISYRVRGGMQRLVIALAEQLDQSNTKTGCAVAGVRKSNDKWLVTSVHQGKEQTFGANHLILAIPPRLIAKYLTPEQYMSEKITNDLHTQQTWMSGQAKFVATYSNPFWREKGLSGQAFSHVGPMIEIHDASSNTDSGFALFGFIGLQSDVRSQLSIDQLKSQCLDQLSDLFGPEALSAEMKYLKDWAQDKWVATDQDIMESPQHASFPMLQHKKELESLNLHLAASEFAHMETGYLEGALLASDTAVKACCQKL
jgi:monoamine oxidase